MRINLLQNKRPLMNLVFIPRVQNQEVSKTNYDFSDNALVDKHALLHRKDASTILSVSFHQEHGDRK